MAAVRDEVLAGEEGVLVVTKEMLGWREAPRPPVMVERAVVHRGARREGAREGVKEGVREGGREGASAGLSRESRERSSGTWSGRG